MNSTVKLTAQGVRDLDFGWKKKVVAVSDHGNVPVAEPAAPPPASTEQAPPADALPKA
jgi:hypothetical protein